jgi:hypothetical protein
MFRNSISTGKRCLFSACDAPFHGLFCNNTCPQSCKDMVCDRYDKKCDSCITDFYGNECEIQCGNYKGDNCIQETGVCINGCDDGFYTSTCTLPCKHNVCLNCSVSSGECSSCKEKLWGNNCDSNCSEFCSPSQLDGSVKCERFTAVCVENTCLPGYYGRECRNVCNNHCGINSLGYRTCDIDTGICNVDDCDKTWYGPQCSQACPINCVNQKCNRTGQCVEGCLDEYWGATCQ